MEVVRIQEVRFRENICVILGRTSSISNIVKYVLCQKICLTNPSVLARWKDFDIQKNESEKELELKAREIEGTYVPFDVICRRKSAWNDTQEYFYNNLVDANYQLDLFKGDEYGEYRTISVVNSKTDEIYRILFFDTNSYNYSLDLSKDDIVRIKDEFCISEENRRALYSVRSIDDINRSVIISCINDANVPEKERLIGLRYIVTTGKKVYDL